MQAALNPATGKASPAKPPIVYVPGIDGTGQFLMDTEKRLSKRFQVHTANYSGSDASRGVEGLADDLEAAVAERGLERCLVLAESFGGPVAISWALRHPERVAGLALVNTFARYPHRLRLGLARLGAPVMGAGLFRMGRSLATGRALFGELGTPEILERFRELGEGAVRMDAAYRARLSAVAQVDLRGRLSEIQCPVLLVAGGQDRVVPSVRLAKEMDESLVDTRRREVGPGGHLLLPLELDWSAWLFELAARSGLVQPVVLT